MKLIHDIEHTNVNNWTVWGWLFYESSMHAGEAQ